MEPRSRIFRFLVCDFYFFGFRLRGTWDVYVCPCVCFFRNVSICLSVDDFASFGGMYVGLLE